MGAKLEVGFDEAIDAVGDEMAALGSESATTVEVGEVVSMVVQTRYPSGVCDGEG